MKVSSKIEALRKAGVSVNNLFSLVNADGNECIARATDGILTIVPDDDPIFRSISEGGTIKNPNLFRRWVMAQMFHMLATGDFSKALRYKGYQYEWKMAEEEYRVQAILYANDKTEYERRNRFFNRRTAVEMAYHYINYLERKSCKNKYSSTVALSYDKIVTRNTLDRMITTASNAQLNIFRATNPSELYEAVKEFRQTIKRLWFPNSFLMSKAFTDAYKGAGGYYTMRNMILFHNCTFPNHDVTSSLQVLQDKSLKYKEEGWRMLAMLKQFIADNNIDVNKKIAEWQK